jgi:NADPH-dependent 7-cyano-7-deazaguanine reductase QueF-like protein
MSPIQVESLVFNFPSSVAAEKYDDWQHANQDWANRHGKKKVDIVALDPIPGPRTNWLIEAKDYRVITNPPNRSNVASLPQTVAQKVTDTLLGLADAAVNGQVASEKAHATAAIATAIRRVVLHLEPHPPSGTHTALFPANFAANVYQTLRPLVAHIDSKPLVLNIANTPMSGVPWTVS